jgi:hypothetical protein
MQSTETPAERIACDVALAIYEGASPLPSPQQLTAAYDVPPATVAAAEDRLAAARLAVSAEDGGAMQLLAAAAMCRRLNTLLGRHAINPIHIAGYGTVEDAGQAVQVVAEQFLMAARRPGAGSDEYLGAKAQEILELGTGLTAGQKTGSDFPWCPDLAAVSFPADVGHGLSAATRGPRGPGELRARSAARRSSGTTGHRPPPGMR